MVFHIKNDMEFSELHNLYIRVSSFVDFFIKLIFFVLQIFHL